MNKITLLITLFFLNISAASAEPQNHFVPGISDLPVPINFYLEEDSDSIFYDDNGRIIEATFIGIAKAHDIDEFYDDTLKALGWKKIENLKYIRDKELLTITSEIIDDENFNNLKLNFLLTPYNNH